MRYSVDMTQTEAVTITNEQIQALRAEAVHYGDHQLVKDCDAALLGDAKARLFCESVFAYATDAATWE